MFIVPPPPILMSLSLWGKGEIKKINLLIHEICKYSNIKKISTQEVYPGLVIHTSNSSTWEAQGSRPLFDTNLVYIENPGQSRLHRSKTLS